MARLKSVDLRICFSTKYSNTPVGVKYNYQQTTLDKGQTFIDLPVESIDQAVDIEFFGFVPDDKMQVIKLNSSNSGLNAISFLEHTLPTKKDSFIGGCLTMENKITLEVLKDKSMTSIA